MNENSNSTYRADIDGLRALAVLAVVFYHAKLGFPGGFTGVDVFFVISGYLITGILLRELSAGRFLLTEFWARRIRRIMPAATAMVAVTLAAGPIFLLPSDFAILGKSAVAHSMLVANIFFWRDDTDKGGYFGIATEDRPLKHTWSLAVEEQFYLLFPLVLMLAFRFLRGSARDRLGSFIAVATVAGLLLAGIGVALRPGASFYLLPTRAWELLCGALLACAPFHHTPKRWFIRELMAWGGLAAILYGFFCYSKTTPFPGWSAIPPCLGSMLVIAGGSTPAGSSRPGTLLSRLLSFRPLVLIGLLSYSLYLWHWPILVFCEHLLFDRLPLSPWLRWLLVAISFVLAWISWRCLEVPLRHSRWLAKRQTALAFGAASASFCLLSGLLITIGNGFPTRVSELAFANDKARYDVVDSGPGAEFDDVVSGHLVPLAGDPATKTSPHPFSLVLWGDSHAMQLIPAAKIVCSELGITGYTAVYSATPPLLDAVYRFPDGLQERTPAYANAVLQFIRSHQIPAVILAARWSGYQGADPILLESSLRKTIVALHEAGCTVWVVKGLPSGTAGQSVAATLARMEMYGRKNSDLLPTRENHLKANSVVERLSQSDLPAIFLDPAPLLLDESGSRYRLDEKGVSVFWDDNHITQTASLRLFKPLLKSAIEKEISRRSQPH